MTKLIQPPIYTKKATRIAYRTIKALNPCTSGLERFWIGDCQRGANTLETALVFLRERACTLEIVGQSDYSWVLGWLKAPIFNGVTIHNLATKYHLTANQVIAYSITLRGTWDLIWSKYKQLRSRGMVK